MNDKNKKIVYEKIKDFYKKFEIDQICFGKSVIEKIRKKDDILLLKFPNNLGVSGIAMKKKDRDREYKCIYINTNDPLGRQSFSFIHEIYHIYYEKAFKGVCLESDKDKDEIEKRAEIFASNILIPRIILLAHLKELKYNYKKNICFKDILKLQQDFNVSFQSIMYAIESLKKDIYYIDELEDKEKYYKIIPKIPKDLKRFYTNWEELEEKTKLVDPYNNLNKKTGEFEFPQFFKDDIINNYKKNLIDFEDASIIFEFFNQKFEIK